MSITLIPNGNTFNQFAGLNPTKAEFYIQDFQADLANDASRRERRAYPHLSAQDEPVVRYTFDSTDLTEFEAFSETVIEAARNDIVPAPDFPGGFYDGSELELAQALAVSINQGVRGARAVFVDEDTGIVLIGTSVLYNGRHFTSDFKDPIVQAAFDQAQVSAVADAIFDQGAYDPFKAGQEAAADATVPVDLAELATIAASLRQRAKPKVADAIFDRTQGVDEELLDYAERLERQVIAAGGSLGGARANAKDVADELIAGATELFKQGRDRVEEGLDRLKGFWRNLDKK